MARDPIGSRTNRRENQRLLDEGVRDVDDGSLTSKVAIVTGGASGMSLATAKRFLRRGWPRSSWPTSKDNGEQFLRDVDAAGWADRAEFLRTDVASEADIEAVVALAVERFGQLDVIFNNAGIGGAVGPIAERPVENWDYTFNVMLRGVFLGVEHTARQMKAQGWGGSILNTASTAGLLGDSGPLCYRWPSAVVHLARTAAAARCPIASG